MVQLRVSGQADLRRVGRNLGRAGATGRPLRSNMRKAIVASVKPMQTAVKANIAAIPAHGPAHTGLRAAMIRATKIRIRTAGANAMVRLQVDGRLMPDGQKSLPSLMEGDKRRWRHPVFGHEQVWVQQASHPYFAPAVMPRIAGVRAAVVAAVNVTAAQIERGI